MFGAVYIVDRLCQQLSRLLHVTTTNDEEIAEEKVNRG